MSIAPGLCGTCKHVRRIVSARGSTFYRCSIHDVDPRWPKYPPLPVRSCERHEPT